MRNTPYTLGSRSHAIVALAEDKGKIQGIVGFHGAHDIHSQDVDDFEYLPKGEKKLFADAESIEIVIFDASSISGIGSSSFICKRRVDLEKGATLTGPMSWRPTSVDADTVNQHSDPIAFGAVCLGITLFGRLLSFISSTISVPIVAAGIFCLVLWLIIHAADKVRCRAIARLGSAYVLARRA
jgi:hypothetical protein